MVASSLPSSVDLHFRRLGARLVGRRADAQLVRAGAGELRVARRIGIAAEGQRAVLVRGRGALLFHHEFAPAVLLHLRLAVVDEERLRRDLLGGVHEFLHEHRRNREHVGDVVEAEADLVIREVVRLEVHVHQLGDGPLVLVAIQPAHGHAAGVFLERAIDLRQLAVEEMDDQVALVVGRLRLFLRRHVAGRERGDDLLPSLAILLELRVLRQRDQVDIALLLVGVVAIEAELLEHRLNVRAKGDRAGLRGRLRRRRQARAEQQEEQEKTGAKMHGRAEYGTERSICNCGRT